MAFGSKISNDFNCHIKTDSFWKYLNWVLNQIKLIFYKKLYT